jgi:type II secretory ATPase GspE/PulE/Tfp pilus assembly ATPase PilB-like protein
MSHHTTQYMQSVTAAQPVEIATLVNYILLDSVEAGASDIHIEPWEGALVVRIRVNGQLKILDYLPLDLADKIAGRIKVMADLPSFEKGVPMDGRAPTPPEFGGVTLRVSVMPLTKGEKIVMRIFDPRKRKFDLKALGFEDETLDEFLQLLNKPSGLILLNGPTGSGKTTAIYASLYYLTQKHGAAISISTVEDPVEAPLAMISQSQLNPAQNFTYPIALRSLLRQDPEAIMIGEIRDPDTASIAIQAGLTGHLVISTIHSGSTAGIYARMINMGIEPFLLCSSVVGVLGVRLVRKNCDYCAVPYSPPEDMLRNFSEEVLNDAQFRKGEGCGQCNGSGYAGRTAITELLKPSERLRKAIIEKQPTRILMEMAVADGMRTLYDNGLKRVFRGETTFEEVLTVCTSDMM